MKDTTVGSLLVFPRNRKTVDEAKLLSRNALEAGISVKSGEHDRRFIVGFPDNRGALNGGIRGRLTDAIVGFDRFPNSRWRSEEIEPSSLNDGIPATSRGRDRRLY